MSGSQSNVKSYRYFSGGQWKDAESGKTFEVHEPYSGKSFAHVASASRAGARATMDDAAKAFPAWAEVAAANRTMYGLTSSILSGDTYKAFELAPKVLAGIVNVNSPTVNDEIHAPMGGVRDSGWGRTGPRSLDDFSDLIWINSHSGQRQYPF
jgi:acyl-CoA reductase-like NAD-dependent aldehyde dehydrogenase